MDKTFHIDGNFLQEDARESFGRADHWNTESEAEHQAVEEATHEHAKTLARYPLGDPIVWDKTTGITEEDFYLHKIGIDDKVYAWFKRAPPSPVAEERTFTLAEMKECWREGFYNSRRQFANRNTFGEYLLKRFNITKK